MDVRVLAPLLLAVEFRYMPAGKGHSMVKMEPGRKIYELFFLW
jgi:hypothetical protein